MSYTSDPDYTDELEGNSTQRDDNHCNEFLVTIPSTTSAQYIVFDLRYESNISRGKLITAPNGSEFETDSVDVICHLCQSDLQQNTIKILSKTEMEDLFGKDSVNANNTLKFAKVVFIEVKRNVDSSIKLLTSERAMGAAGNNIIFENDASDFLAMVVSPDQSMNYVVNTFENIFRQKRIQIFHRNRMLATNCNISHHIKQNISIVRLVVQKLVQVRVTYPLQYNRREILTVECLNTDIIREFKEKLKCQFALDNYDVKEMHLTQDRELPDDEHIHFCMKTKWTGLHGYQSDTYDSLFYYDDVVLHTVYSPCCMVNVHHSSRTLPVYINTNSNTMQLRYAVATLTQCYPQSLKLVHSIAGQDVEIPEVDHIEKEINEFTILHTRMRDKIDLHITVVCENDTQKFLLSMYDLNTVTDLENEMSTYLQIDSYLFDVIHDKRQLKNFQTFKDLNFRSHEDIEVVVYKNRIRVRVLYPKSTNRDNKVTEVEIDDPAQVTVAMFLSYWAIKLECEETILRLVHDCRCLDSKKTFLEARIENNDLLCVRQTSVMSDVIPGKLEKVISITENGEMFPRFGKSENGIMFYCADWNYTENIQALKKQRSLDLMSRKPPKSVRIYEKSVSMPEMKTANPQISFPKRQTNENCSSIPMIHSSEEKLRVNKTSHGLPCNDKTSHGLPSDDIGRSACVNYTNSDISSIRTFSQSKRKQKTSDLLATTSDDANLPDFRTIFPKKQKCTDMVQEPHCMIRQTISETRLITNRTKANRIIRAYFYLLLTSSHAENHCFVAHDKVIWVLTQYIDSECFERKAPAESGMDVENISNKELQPKGPKTDAKNQSKDRAMHEEGTTNTKLMDIAKKAFSDWKNLSRSLDLEESDIVSIDSQNNNDVVEKCYQALLKWKQKLGSEAMPHTLKNALLDIRNREAADLLDESV